MTSTNEEKIESEVLSCGCFVLLVFVVIGLSFWLLGGESPAERILRERIAESETFLMANDYTVNVIGIYTSYDNKGRATGQSAVIEGIKTKERRTVPVRPKLPVVGEKWKIDMDEKGYLTLEKVVK